MAEGPQKQVRRLADSFFPGRARRPGEAVLNERGDGAVYSARFGRRINHRGENTLGGAGLKHRGEQRAALGSGLPLGVEIARHRADFRCRKHDRLTG